MQRARRVRAVVIRDVITGLRSNGELARRVCAAGRRVYGCGHGRDGIAELLVTGAGRRQTAAVQRRVRPSVRLQRTGLFAIRYRRRAHRGRDSCAGFVGRRTIDAIVAGFILRGICGAACGQTAHLGHGIPIFTQCRALAPARAAQRAARAGRGCAGRANTADAGAAAGLHQWRIAYDGRRAVASGILRTRVACIVVQVITGLAFRYGLGTGIIIINRGGAIDGQGVRRQRAIASLRALGALILGTFIICSRPLAAQRRARHRRAAIRHAGIAGRMVVGIALHAIIATAVRVIDAGNRTVPVAGRGAVLIA